MRGYSRSSPHPRRIDGREVPRQFLIYTQSRPYAQTSRNHAFPGDLVGLSRVRAEPDARRPGRARQGAERARDPLRVGPQPAEASPQPVSRRGHRRGHELQGAHLRLHAQPADAAVRIRSEGQLTSARSARACTVSCSLTRCAWIRRTTSGRSTKAPTWSSSSIPRAAW